MDALREAGAAVPEAAEGFYRECLEFLKESGLPFVVGGTYAVMFHTGILRRTKDLDLFCKASDYPKIIEMLARAGFATHVEDERWMAKISRGEYYIDLIFSVIDATAPVTDDWLEESVPGRLFGIEVPILSPTALVWSKIFLVDRMKYDGPDVMHVLLRQYDKINWEKLMRYMGPNWEVLLAALVLFRFIYPSEREKIPREVLDELLERLHRQIDMPTSKVRVCRGRLFSRGDYEVDVREWEFADLIGEGKRHEE